ncbi:MAG: tetraacyldisaccharide 4'-kinase [Capsulimonadaceae bacterium]
MVSTTRLLSMGVIHLAAYRAVDTALYMPAGALRPSIASIASIASIVHTMAQDPDRQPRSESHRPGGAGYLLRVIDTGAPLSGPAPAALRCFLAGCASLYDLGLEAYLRSEGVGLRRRDRLPAPVISIGNLTVGGTGKTPMAAWLCRRLRDRGLRVTLLSRGHGGISQDARVVSDPEGRILRTAADAGDEPVLLARLCPGVPVVVGKDRRLSGREALRRWPVDVFVLDDGFQFWQLARDLDIVLLDSRLPFDNGYPLPRGLLREPARHLQRAPMAVVTRADRLDAAGRAAIQALIRQTAPDISVYYASHRPECYVETTSNSVVPLDTLVDAPVLALSAIAQPDSFHRTLEAAVARVAGTLSFADHHAFAEPDVYAAVDAARACGARAIVMTEKDAVKWPTLEAASPVPTFALRIGMYVENDDAFLAEVLRRSLENPPSSWQGLPLLA